MPRPGDGLALLTTAGLEFAAVVHYRKDVDQTLVRFESGRWGVYPAVLVELGIAALEDHPVWAS
jgi:hypothetical protein